MEAPATALSGGSGSLVIPAHVAIIMDGNGRWAVRRGLPRAEGHRAGVEALRRTVRIAGELGVRYLTIYSFSSENWSRPRSEVLDLMALLRRFIRNDLAELHRNGIRIRVIGRRDDLDADIRALLDEAESLTRDNDGLTLVVAFNYGGRDDIARAVRRMVEEVASGTLDPGEIDGDCLSRHLDTAGVPDPDLMIRTGGEQRISNFLLWQCAYTEFVFSQVYWPDFGRDDFIAAIEEFRHRERRFGGLAAQAAK
ncbi:isoprenyl transferase [Microbaculum marinum]|uniref:Isoprenyl transferase n=1 Tax=Microbaculum marinum TaxID=1764581 RepID=A0AAW9S0F6_9HYPH